MSSVSNGNARENIDYESEESQYFPFRCQKHLLITQHHTYLKLK